MGRSPDADRNRARHEAMLRARECRDATKTFRRRAMPVPRVGRRATERQPCRSGRLFIEYARGLAAATKGGDMFYISRSGTDPYVL